jgi:hypothetical protein
MTKGPKSDDNIAYMQKLCSEETGSEIEDPRFTKLRRSKEDTQ